MQSHVAQEPRWAEQAIPGSRRILIVEDESAVAEVLSIYLTRQGFSAIQAGTGRHGLELARQHRPHLVLLDLRLPDMSGFQVCQGLEDDLVTRNTPVIMLSGMQRPDIIRRSRAAGCHFYVRKPYDPNALLILIQQAIGEMGE